jgi:hypothetical protein
MSHDEILEFLFFNLPPGKETDEMIEQIEKDFEELTKWRIWAVKIVKVINIEDNKYRSLISDMVKRR